ncbi:SDR family oxidoreductase [soil metagenome]
MGNAPAHITLVTGASRGLGAEVAAQLAAADTHVVVHYRENYAHAHTVAAAIRDAGGHASTVSADISDEAATTAMIESIGARFGRLDTLILNASGDRDTQRRLALLAMPLMSAGGRIVFVTNHQAHFFPNKAVAKGCAPLAASKRAAETALYALRFEFARAGIQYTLVSGSTADEKFAAAIANAATTTSPTGVVYVGSADYLMTA